MRYIKEGKYEGFSLVEMLITIVIIGMVMLIASITLTTLIKTSTVSSNKTRVRNETEFILELVRRTVRNSNPSEVFIFNSSSVRLYDAQEEKVIDNPQAVDVNAPYSASLGENIQGNEIHFRPYGYKNWICIGFFRDSNEENDLGYILKTSTQDLWAQHSKCFNSISDQNPDYAKYTILLNSQYVDIDSFNIAYTLSSDNNYIIRFDLSAQPMNWYLASGAPVNREVFRQAVVSTEGLVW